MLHLVTSNFIFYFNFHWLHVFILYFYLFSPQPNKKKVTSNPTPKKENTSTESTENNLPPPTLPAQSSDTQPNKSENFQTVLNIPFLYSHVWKSKANSVRVCVLYPPSLLGNQYWWVWIPHNLVDSQKRLI